MSIEVRQTPEYETWFRSLRDRMARVRIDIRIRRLSLGNPGNVAPVGDGISELKIDHGPGYRVYFIQRRHLYVLLLAGGDKTTQAADIQRAKTIACRYLASLAE